MNTTGMPCNTTKILQILAHGTWHDFASGTMEESLLASRSGTLPDITRRKYQQLFSEFSASEAERDKPQEQTKATSQSQEQANEAQGRHDNAPMDIGVFKNPMAQDVITKVYNYSLRVLVFTGDEPMALLQNLRQTLVPDLVQKILIVKVLDIDKIDADYALSVLQDTTLLDAAVISGAKDGERQELCHKLIKEAKVPVISMNIGEMTQKSGFSEAQTPQSTAQKAALEAQTPQNKQL